MEKRSRKTRTPTNSFSTINDIKYFRPDGEGGNGPPERKFTKLGGKVNFGVLSLKLNAIWAKRGPSASFCRIKRRSHAKAVFSDQTNMSAARQMKNGFTYYIKCI